MPVGGFQIELPAAGAREGVEFGAAGVIGLTPFGVQPTFTFEALKGGEEGAGIGFEDTERHLFDTAGNAEAMHGLEAEGFEDEHVESALDEIGVGFGHFLQDRRSSLDCQDVRVISALGRIAA